MEREPAQESKDYMFVVLPFGKFLSQEKAIKLEEVWYQMMISQISAVIMARKEISATMKVDVYDTYRRIFDVEMSDEALRKAVQRNMNRRDLKYFTVLPRRN